MGQMPKSLFVQITKHLRQRCGRHLNHGTQFLTEQHLMRTALDSRQVYLKSSPRSKGHLHQGRKETPIGSIVVGQKMAVLIELLNRPKEALKGFRIIQIRADLAQFAINLRQHRSTQSMTSLTQVDEQQLRITKVQPKFRCQRLSNIEDGRKRGDDQ